MVFFLSITDIASSYRYFRKSKNLFAASDSSLRFFMATPIVLLGIILVNGNIHAESYSGFGVFCALMSALMYACMVSFNKKAEDIVGMENSTLQLTIAYISVCMFVIAKQGFYFQILSEDLAPLLFLGLVNTGLGCFLYFSSIGSIKIQTVAILGYLEPLSAVFFSFIFLKEILSPVQLIGAVFIIGGAVLTVKQAFFLPGMNTLDNQDYYNKHSN